VSKSGHYDEHIAVAQTVSATLEGLEVEVVTGRVDLQAAAVRYAECVDKASFLQSGV